MWKQEHSNKPQMFLAKGDVVLVCRSANQNYLVLSKGLMAPTSPIGEACDFFKALNNCVNTFQQPDKYQIGGLIKMEQVIIEDTFEQNIRNIFYLEFKGKEDLEKGTYVFKSVDEILSNSQDSSLKEYIKYIQTGGVVFPMEVFVQEGEKVKLPAFSSKDQEQKLREIQKKILQN